MGGTLRNQKIEMPPSLGDVQKTEIEIRYYSITTAGEAMLAHALERYRVLDQAVAQPSQTLKPSRA
jgi:DNA-binding PadR family transcriptional regulator